MSMESSRRVWTRNTLGTPSHLPDVLSRPWSEQKRSLHSIFDWKELAEMKRKDSFGRREFLKRTAGIVGTATQVGSWSSASEAELQQSAPIAAGVKLSAVPSGDRLSAHLYRRALKTIAFPLGGVAAGSLSLGGRGQRYKLEGRRLSPATINLRLAAIRRLAYEASDKGILNHDLRRVKGAKRFGMVSLVAWIGFR
jgi:hypothetical protein